MFGKVIISDYPAPAALATIRLNAKKAITPSLESVYSIQGHEWGDLTSAFALKYQHYFERIIAADCFWMPSQHLNLVRSILHFLTLDPRGEVFVVSGFHTGRAKLASFFDVAEEEGLETEEIFEEDVEGNLRAWAHERDGGMEDPTERKRWLVIARLGRMSPWKVL